MVFELDASNAKYIKIIVSGMVTKPYLISAISQLMQHSEYIDKHSFWDFTDARMGLSIEDLKEIVGILRLYKPKQKNFANKSALLVSGEMNKAMVNVFATMTKLLPFKYRVFTDWKQAEAYVSS